MPFDPFGDHETRRCLRNRAGTKDPAVVTQLEGHAFAANVLPALTRRPATPTLSYDNILDTHRRLVGSVYPWAGEDRTTLAPTIAITKAGMADLFAHPADVRRAGEYTSPRHGTRRTSAPIPARLSVRSRMLTRFFISNDRTLMTIHADLARRGGFHIAWQDISNAEFLSDRKPSWRPSAFRAIASKPQGAMFCGTTRSRNTVLAVGLSRPVAGRGAFLP